MSVRHPTFSPAIGAALLAAALLILAGVFLARYEDRVYSAQQVKDVGEQANILAASVTAAIVFDDRGAAQEYVDALKVNPELQAAAVYDAKGDRIAQFTRQGAGPPARAPGIATMFADDHLDVSIRVVQHGDNVGTVFLRAAAEPAQRRLARYVGLVLLVTMGALVIAVLGFSQAALARRAAALAAANVRLQVEMAERQKTEEALRQSHKMEAVGQLSGGIAHDFNNLIMIVKSSLRLLRKRLGGGIEQAEQYIASAEEALDRAAGLTQRILAFSRRQPLNPTLVQMNDLVVGITELLRHSVGEKIAIETRLDATWWTLCDVNQMENVILNLAINARDAMPDGGRLTIETADTRLDSPPPDASDLATGDYSVLLVRDTGEGMSETVRQRAVDPFFTTKPMGKGTGLGLSMTFGYVRQSGGYLTIESAPGQGTTIKIFMPRAEKPS